MTRYRHLAVLAVVAILAAACSNPPPETGGGPAPTGGTVEGYEHLTRAKAGEFSGTTVDVLAQWVDAESDNFEASLQPFIDQTGIDVNYEGITDYETVLTVRVEGGDAPDIAQIAQPGKMRSFAEAGNLVNLSEWINVDQLSQDYIASFLDLATFNGNVYGVYYRTDTKSIVWYPNQAFADAGYSVPATWDQMIALSDQIVADGNGNPWCISIEHGDASGWVATDWVEDILLRTAPPEVYDQWMAHQIPFNAPEVMNAVSLMEQVWFTPDYVYGGNKAINNTFVGDTQHPMFHEDGPKCWMHKQAAWMPSFWPKDPATEEPLFEPGVDSSFFYFPPIDDQFGNPVLGGADMFVMFNDRPEVRALMEYLATAEAAQAWITAGGFVSPNKSVPLSWYSTYPSSGLAEIIAGATTLRFDASDIMPAEVGGGSFWSGMVEWVSNNGEGEEQIFQDIEASWPAG